VGVSDDQQHTAEAFDPDELGDDPTGELEYPADRPLGSSDPTRDDRVTDSVRDREWREEPELDRVEEPDEVGRLVAPNDVLADDESDAVASAADEDDLSAEEAAVHVDEEG
jgi:hypothetical protein